MAQKYFDPKPTRYPFPEQTDQHYLVVKKDRGYVFDESYPYVDESKPFLRKRKWVNVLLRLIVFPMTRVKLSLRIKGKKNIRKYREVINQGAIGVSNHVNMWDYLAILAALKPKKPAILAWGKNINGESGTLMRLVGGIPIPDHDLKATKVFLEESENHVKNGGFLQIYAEGSMWEYYAPIRPFKTGAAYYAVKCGRPIIPMAFSYRKPTKIRRLFGPLGSLTLTVGEPIYPNPELKGQKAQDELTIRVHDEVCRLAGIEPEKNPYGALFHNDKRVDYYH